MKIIEVCTDRICKNVGKSILDRLKREKNKQQKLDFQVEGCACMGQCKKGPNIKINGTMHHDMDPIKASKLIKK